MLRRTKIIATLGPATDDAVMLANIIHAGVDLVRVNFSHGEKSQHQQRIHRVREIAAQQNKPVAILADLQGPKIRIARFRNNAVILHEGQSFCLDAQLADDAGDENCVGIDYKNLPKDVQAGDILLLNDGLLELKVDEVERKRILCTVLVGGELSNNKGINKLGGGLSAPALTEKDKQDLITATELSVDYLAISFPRSAQDIHSARELLNKAGGSAGIIAKIERVEAVQNLSEIIDAADGVMVARGDLGVELGDAELPAVQKQIIQACRSQDKPVITATQMMESMVYKPIPTRAEVFDVANAVLDGTDAVMLSAETAVGEYPDKVVSAMARVCLGAEKTREAKTSRHRIECHFERVDEAIAMSAMYCANHANVKAIIALTESGSTPLWMSRIRSGIPIYALCNNQDVLCRMNLYRGVYPIRFDISNISSDQINQSAIAHLQAQEIVVKGDWVIVTRGDRLGVHGHTNSLKILEV
jgi:pyruvate kinase